jgi:hypothetical protein
MKGGINFDNAGLNQPGNFGKGTGDHVDPAGSDFFTGHPACEKGLQSVLMVLVPSNGDGGAKAHQLNEFQIPEVSGIGIQQALDQRTGFCNPCSQKMRMPGLILASTFRGATSLDFHSLDCIDGMGMVVLPI